MIPLVRQVARPPAATTHQQAAQPFQSPIGEIRLGQFEKYIFEPKEM